MKRRIIILLLAMLLTVSGFQTVCSAQSEQSRIFESGSLTVEVSAANLTDADAERIADSFMGYSGSVPSYLSSMGDRVSHTLKVYTTTVTEHNYYDSVPACRKSVYKVTLCTDAGCDYMLKELLSATRVGCCMAKIFKDVGYGEWYSRAVLLMKQRGIMLGSDGYFEPKDDLTRAEFAMILARFANADLDKYIRSAFTDAPITAWYGSAVAWAKSNKIVDGYSPKYFGPGDPITREQMCVMLNNYAEQFDLELSEGVKRDFLDKNEISSWAEDAVNKCSAWSIVNGMEDGSFRPRDNTTRAQTAQMMYNLIHKAGLAYNKAFKEAGNNDYSGGGTGDWTSGDMWGGISDRYPFLDDIRYYSFEKLAYRFNMNYESIYNEYTKNEHAYFSGYYDATVLTEEEFVDGITLSCYRRISERGTVLFPMVDGAEATFRGDKVVISLDHYDLLKRTSISYDLRELGVVDIIDMPEEILDVYKDATVTELLSALDSNVLNVRSYTDATVDYFCEREFTLADRTVTAFVSRYCGNREGYVHIWFAYDGAIVRMYGHEDIMAERLSKLSFSWKELK